MQQFVEHRALRLVAVAVALTMGSALLIGCADRTPEQDVASESVDSARLQSDRTAADSAGPGLASDPAGAECPETGEWRSCSVEKRLERAGLVAVRQDAEVRHAFLTVPGTVYRLGSEELQVFLYPSADARSRDLADVDSATVTPRDASVAWAATPTLIVSNNLAAILIGGGSRQVERVTFALTAGLPQP